jgi:hypothetical protein
MILKNTYIRFEKYDIEYVYTEYKQFEEYGASTRMNGDGQTLMDGNSPIDGCWWPLDER